MLSKYKTSMVGTAQIGVAQLIAEIFYGKKESRDVKIEKTLQNLQKN